MGEYADMVLDGTVDSETGEYIGSKNKAMFGSESPGFPVSYEQESRQKTACPQCGKKIKVSGLDMHIRDVHIAALTSQISRRARCLGKSDDDLALCWICFVSFGRRE